MQMIFFAGFRDVGRNALSAIESLYFSQVGRRERWVKGPGRSAVGGAGLKRALTGGTHALQVAVVQGLNPSGFQIIAQQLVTALPPPPANPTHSPQAPTGASRPSEFHDFEGGHYSVNGPPKLQTED